MPFDTSPPPASGPVDLRDNRVVADLRSDHAGESGAVHIYHGVLAVTRDPLVRSFAAAHLATETDHLKRIEGVLPPAMRSRLTPLWRVAGWITGALPALVGPGAVYRTIEAVETFVDRHYQEQINYFRDSGGDRLLLEILEDCRADEARHRDEARELSPDAAPGPFARLWARLVESGSKAAVAAARRI
ncbi:MAG: demethoxyubiquinone hydroxylase family protein [Alphaproteobacteria bacterium]|nr:demethoxyubiquinone hydroxylase family protein [Alphaproteobacteria bacterium]